MTTNQTEINQVYRRKKNIQIPQLHNTQSVEKNTPEGEVQQQKKTEIISNIMKKNEAKINSNNGKEATPDQKEQLKKRKREI